MLANQRYDTAATLTVDDGTSMNSGGADKGVTAIDEIRIAIRGPPDNQGLIYDLLGADGTGIQDLFAETVGGAAKCE